MNQYDNEQSSRCHYDILCDDRIHKEMNKLNRKEKKKTEKNSMISPEYGEYGNMCVCARKI